LTERLEAMRTIGLGYLNLARATTTLSGGESQRIKTVKHLTSSLTTMTYIVDEPTVGLHPADVATMLDLLERLRDAGNHVLVVEHDPVVMARADQIIEIGPGAGADGGTLVYQGTWTGLRAADTPTARALARRRPRTATPRRPTGRLTVREATRNNLQHLTVTIPTGVLTVLTGVAGSGKSSLAAELVTQHGATVIDQRPVATNRRSTPITYTGIAAPIRSLFARVNGVPAHLFSANSAAAGPRPRRLRHRSGVPGRAGIDLPELSGPPVQRRGTGPHRQRAEHCRGERAHRGGGRGTAGRSEDRTQAASPRGRRTRLPAPRP